MAVYLALALLDLVPTLYLSLTIVATCVPRFVPCYSNVSENHTRHCLQSMRICIRNAGAGGSIPLFRHIHQAFESGRFQWNRPFLFSGSGVGHRLRAFVAPPKRGHSLRCVTLLVGVFDNL